MDKKEEIPAKDYETGLDIARRYATQYLFGNYLSHTRIRKTR
jgi:hypothetical protein